MSGNMLALVERDLREQAPALQQVLPRDLPVERLMRTVIVSIDRLPALMECSKASIMNAAMTAAVLGLEVDGVTGQGYLIPFKGKAQFITGYKGLNTVASRGGLTVTAGTVREGDAFDYQEGTAAFVHHKKKLGNSRAPAIAYYAVATAPGRTPIVSLMDIDEILAVKAKSPGSKKSDSPWNDAAIGFHAMAEKTARRRLARSVPFLPLQRAVSLEDAVDMDRPAHLQQDGTLVIDGEASPLPTRDTVKEPDMILAPDDEPLPLRAPDGVLHQIKARAWVRAVFLALQSMNSVQTIGKWRQDNGENFGEVAQERPELVQQAEAAIAGRLEEL